MSALLNKIIELADVEPTQYDNIEDYYGKLVEIKQIATNGLKQDQLPQLDLQTHSIEITEEERQEFIEAIEFVLPFELVECSIKEVYFKNLLKKLGVEEEQ